MRLWIDLNLRIKVIRPKIRDIKNYKKQRNYVVQLNEKAKLEYFNNFDSSQEGKYFWVKCKPYISNKHSKADTDIILHEKGDIIF